MIVASRSWADDLNAGLLDACEDTSIGVKTFVSLLEFYLGE